MLGSAKRLALKTAEQLQVAMLDPRAVSDLKSMRLSRLRALILRSRLFDAEYYQKQCGARGSADPCSHYLQVGEPLGMRPNEFFDPIWYGAHHPDPTATLVNQLAHYAAFGCRTGRSPGPGFDSRFYLSEYPDVAALGIDPLRHYLEIGRLEGRLARAGQAPIAPGDWFQIANRYNVSASLLLTSEAATRPAEQAFFRVIREAQAAPPATLHVLHRGGGGTERLVAETANRSCDRQLVLFSHQIPDGVRIALLTGGKGVWERFDFHVADVDFLVSVLEKLNVGRIHIHQPRELLESLQHVVEQLRSSLDITINDFSLLCPRDSFVNVSGMYCGEPDSNGCAVCLRQKPAPIARDILKWRSAGVALLRRADRVFCPSEDTMRRILRYVPEAKVELVAPVFNGTAELLQLTSTPDRIKIAVIGTCSDHKGGRFLLDCVDAARKSGLGFDWTVLGYFSGSVVRRAHRMRHLIDVIGAYQPAQMRSELLTRQPDLVFFPQHCIETYSYALSEALSLGIPILVPDLGVFPERVADRKDCSVYSPWDSPSKVVDQIKIWHQIRQRRRDSAPASH